MNRFSLSIATALVAVLTASFPGFASAQFGSDLAVIGDEILVLKPGGAFGGLATVYSFQKRDGQWKAGQLFHPEGSTETGQPFGSSMVVDENRIFAAGGDVAVRLGAHVFTRGSGGWRQTGKISFAPETQNRPESTTLSDIMRVIQPPSRVLAMNDDALAISVPGGPADVAGINLFSFEAGAWTRDTTLTSDEKGFGAHIAAGHNRLLVSTAADPVYIYHRSEGKWQLDATLDTQEFSAITRTGPSVLLAGDTAYLGFPAPDTTGLVLVFERTASGEWIEKQRIDAPENKTGNGFGGALERVGDELWVGAPYAEEYRGAVYRFVSASDGSFELAGMLTSEDILPGSGFGASIAGSSGIAVAGAPGAGEGAGLAAVFEKDESGAWQLTNLIHPNEPLESIAGEEHRCEDGEASGYACDKVDLLAFLPTSALGAEHRETVSDLWGWTDPTNGREYALIGRTSGASIVDISTPTIPVYIGLVPANPTWVRDLKVYQDHLFFTGDGAGDHGLVVFDLTRLREPAERPSTFVPDTVYHGIASAHNLILDTESGFAYAVGSSQGGETCGGGLHMVDIRQPKNPTFAGCYTDTIGLFSDGRTHDGQCTIYHGPDENYSGRQICFASNETALRIVDVTDKSNPVPIAAARYPRTAYVHQGWLTEDHRYFYLDDELDELVGMTNGTRTMIWDVSELDDPVLVGEFTGSTNATDHNLYVRGDRMYQANYQGGLRIWDITDPEEPVEIGHFDTTREAGNPPGFSGAWTAYPYFESGTIIVSSMHEGLFIVKPSEQVP